MGWLSQEVWSRFDKLPIIYHQGKILLGVFDLRNAIVYSASDSQAGTDFVLAYPNIPELFAMLKSQSRTIVFVATGKRENYEALLATPEGWIDWLIVSPNPLGLLASIINVADLSSDSLYCTGNRTLGPNVLGLKEYRPWEIFQKWPYAPENPQVGASIRNAGHADLIIFVGSSGSGRTEAANYLKSMGYQEVRRKVPTDVNQIRQKLANNQRVFYNATNPSIQDRSRIKGLYPEARIWWFARAGREFNTDRIPEAAYERYSRSFQMPSFQNDGIPVIRMT